MNLLTKDEVLERYDISNYKMRTMLKEGMPHLKIGTCFRFVQEEMEAWFLTYKPKQQRLEIAFRDEKGRTLHEYVEAQDILASFRISAPQLYRLSQQGMPYVKIGRKRYYHETDLLSYFRHTSCIPTEAAYPYSDSPSDLRDEYNRVSVIYDAEPLKGTDIQRRHLFVVDGSHFPATTYIGAGVVYKPGDSRRSPIEKLSFHRNMNVENPIITAEYLAILEALRLVKSRNLTEVLICTDQKPFVKSIQQGRFPIRQWMIEGEGRELFLELRSLINELSHRVQFHYTSLLEQANCSHLHQFAHDLSRQAYNNQFNTFQEKRVKPLQVSFIGQQNTHCYFLVTKDNVQKEVRIEGFSPLRSLFTLLTSYIADTRHFYHFTIDIHQIYQDDKEKLAVSNPDLLDRTKKAFNRIRNLSSIHQEPYFHDLLVQPSAALVEAN